jgi:3-oxoacyl-[acyl-carrier protein] reductase
VINNPILVIGSSGSIGNPLINELKNIGYICITPSSKLLNIKEKNSIESFKNNLPSLSGIIILAGKEPSQNLEKMEWDHLEEMISIHFKGVLWCIKCFKEKIIKGGFIITTSSIATHKGSYDPSYSSMKSAIEGLTRTLVKDLSPHIRINSVAPGLIENSKVYNNMTDDFKQNHLNNIPLCRFTKVKDIIDAYLFLIQNQCITGQTIHINGGQYNK